MSNQLPFIYLFILLELGGSLSVGCMATPAQRSRVSCAPANDSLPRLLCV